MKQKVDLIENINKLWQQRYPGINLSDEAASEISIKIMDLISIMLEWKYRERQKEEIEIPLPKIEAKEKDKNPKERLIPVTKWNDYYDYPPIGGLRSLIFNAETYGFNKVIRKVGGRVLIKEDEFFK